MVLLLNCCPFSLVLSGTRTARDSDPGLASLFRDGNLGAPRICARSKNSLDSWFLTATSNVCQHCNYQDYDKGYTSQGWRRSERCGQTRVSTRWGRDCQRKTCRMTSSTASSIYRHCYRSNRRASSCRERTCDSARWTAGTGRERGCYTGR